MRQNHLIDLDDLSKAQWEQIVELAIRISKSPEKYTEHCKNKIMATLFFEPSTRTQNSFQTAMLRLGGSIIGLTIRKTVLFPKARHWPILSGL